ncbi:hypothetical protein HDU89_007619 [Geranomyces variabilis]|nr:hypothetical protein HDU89_007619 [Geranomyces variabilis]
MGFFGKKKNSGESLNNSATLTVESDSQQHQQEHQQQQQQHQQPPPPPPAAAAQQPNDHAKVKPRREVPAAARAPVFDPDAPIGKAKAFVIPEYADGASAPPPGNEAPRAQPTSWTVGEDETGTPPRGRRGLPPRRGRGGSRPTGRGQSNEPVPVPVAAGAIDSTVPIAVPPPHAPLLVEQQPPPADPVHAAPPPRGKGKAVVVDEVAVGPGHHQEEQQPVHETPPGGAVHHLVQKIEKAVHVQPRQPSQQEIPHEQQMHPQQSRPHLTNEIRVGEPAIIHDNSAAHPAPHQQLHYEEPPAVAMPSVKRKPARSRSRDPQQQPSAPKPPWDDRVDRKPSVLQTYDNAAFEAETALQERLNAPTQQQQQQPGGKKRAGGVANAGMVVHGSMTIYPPAPPQPVASEQHHGMVKPFKLPAHLAARAAAHAKAPPPFDPTAAAAHQQAQQPHQPAGSTIPHYAASTLRHAGVYDQPGGATSTRPRSGGGRPRSSGGATGRRVIFPRTRIPVAGSKRPPWHAGTALVAIETLRRTHAASTSYLSAAGGASVAEPSRPAVRKPLDLGLREGMTPQEEVEALVKRMRDLYEELLNVTDERDAERKAARELRKRVQREQERHGVLPRVTTVVPTSVEANLNLRYQFKKHMDAERERYHKLEDENRDLAARLKESEARHHATKRSPSSATKSRRAADTQTLLKKLKDADLEKQRLADHIRKQGALLEREAQQRTKVETERQVLRTQFVHTLKGLDGVDLPPPPAPAGAEAGGAEEGRLRRRRSGVGGSRRSLEGITKPMERRRKSKELRDQEADGRDADTEGTDGHDDTKAAKSKLPTVFRKNDRHRSVLFNLDRDLREAGNLIDSLDKDLVAAAAHKKPPRNGANSSVPVSESEDEGGMAQRRYAAAAAAATAGGNGSPLVADASGEDKGAQNEGRMRSAKIRAEYNVYVRKKHEAERAGLRPPPLPTAALLPGSGQPAEGGAVS